MALDELTEDELYEELLGRILANTALDGLDKRESSVCYQMLAPVALALAGAYRELFTVRDEMYIDTAGADSLTRRAAEIGLARRDARRARIEAEITPPDAVSIGDRFVCGERVFTVTERAEPPCFVLLAQEAGATAIDLEDALLPFGLDGQTVDAVIRRVVQGEDEESADSLRERYYAFIASAPFGGNRAAYREKVSQIEGVGGCRVDRPANAEDGHNVSITVMSEAYGAIRSPEELERIRSAIDPYPSGEGTGFAPIDHRVTVRSVEPETVRVTVGIRRRDGFEEEDVLRDLNAAAESCAAVVRRDWAVSGEGLLRKSDLFVTLLGVDGVEDILSLSLTDAAGEEQTSIRYDGVYVPFVEVTTVD